MSSITIVKMQAIHKFDSLHYRARWANRWYRFRGQTGTLLSFEAVRRALPTGTMLDRGLQDIPVAAIVGSVGRAADFDPSFRPLNRALRARWVGVRRLQDEVGWDPIAVTQLGSYYFVDDGHHRVSVAHAAGSPAIEAWVSEYAVGARRDMVDALVCEMLSNCTRVAPLISDWLPAGLETSTTPQTH